MPRADAIMLMLLLALPMALAGGEARAHAVLLSSDPAAAGTVAAPPDSIELRFNEPVQVLALRIFDAEGADLTPADPPVSADGRVRLPLGDGLPDGRYLLSWRVNSLDGHVVGGAFTFAVGAATPAPSPGAAPRIAVSTWAVVALRALSRVTLLLAVGVALFRILLSPPPWLRPALDGAVRRLAAAAFVAHLLLAGADGALRAGLEPGNLLAIDAWRAAAAAPTAWLQAATSIGLLSLSLPITLRPLARLAGALLSLATLAASGHVLTALPDGFGQALMCGHGLAAALWIGAIGPLRLALARDAGPQTAGLFRRFQTYGACAVCGVLGSGTAMAWLLLPRLADLWESDYGLRLSAKLAAVGVMLVVALVNRAWLTRPALSGSARMRRRLGAILGLDLAVAVLAVALAAGLSLGPPPPAGLQVRLSGDRYAVELTVVPGRIGDNNAEIVLRPNRGTPTEPKDVEIRIAAPAAGIEAETYRARYVAPGRYRVSGLPLWVAGPWQVRVGVLVDDFTKLYWETTVTPRR
ncbi:MAG: copper resistance CopC/CopD family protein [Dongiaceae bacterium]